MRIVNESINDKNILKCVFLAGGPGSGKSFIANNLFAMSGSISALGVKIINSDAFFELGLAKAGLPSVILKGSEIYDQQMVIRALAKSKTELKQGLHLDSLLPIVIDGTGKDYDKITKQAEYLKSIGYDVSMVFVNTSLEVAQARNAARTRVVDPNLVFKMWSEVQGNMGKFQDYFGRNNFLIIDNNTHFEKNSNEEGTFLMDLFKKGRNLIEKPLENPIGKIIISVLKTTGGKYMSDLPNEFNPKG